MMELPRIPDFFKDKRVFLTGGTGFIGKVFIEKLLRSCPEVDSVYLLMRPKYGKTVEERIKEITDLPLFDILKKEQPNCFKKIKIISGDVMKVGLGLSDEDRQFLINEIDLVYHVAATIRFDITLTEAVLLNTRGTREMALLAAEMKQLKVFVYISTAYCNCDHEVIEEKLYPAHADWCKTIEMCEKLDEKTVNVMTQKYISPLPNTYTFAKHLAEHVVNDILIGKVPIVIARPSIVVSTFRDPFPGWIDNFNGPVAILVAAGKGIVRTMYNDPDILADYIPVDIIVKGMLMVCWAKYYEKDNLKEISYYNGTNSNFIALTFREIVQIGEHIAEEVPMESSLWHPGGGPTKCWYKFYILFMLVQLLPALLVDGALRLIGKKPFLVKIQRRIYSATVAIQYFTTRQWTFINDKALSLEKMILPEDRKDFDFHKEEGDPYLFFKKSCLGGKRYLLNEFDDEKARRHYNRMKMLDMVVRYLFSILLIYLILANRVFLGTYLKQKYMDVHTYFTMLV